MNCKVCGKELTDGRRKICKECAEKEKKEKEEKKAKKAAEKTTKVEANKETKKEETKTEETKKSKFELRLKKKEIIAIAVIVAVILLCLIVGVFASNHGVGNTIGNIRNYGYAAVDGNYIYYLAPNEDSSAVGIFKIKKDGSNEPKELFMEDMDIVSINVYNGYVYFIGIGTEPKSDDDELDNKIYKMKTNGDNLTVINDNEFHNDCYEIYVVDGSIYYIGLDNNIYKMSLNGSNRELVSDNGTGYLGVTQDYIVFNVAADTEENYVTYIMNTNGTDARPIIEGERLYSVNIDKNYVYYTNINKQICKTKIDSGESEILLDTTAYNLNYDNGYIYYLNYKDIANEDYTVCLYKLKVDGSEKEATNIKELDTYSSFIDVVGDWVIYMDSNESEGFINLVRVDGEDELCVYLLDYETYYNQQAANYVYEEVEGSTETEVTPETPVTEVVTPETPVTEETAPETVAQ